MFKINKNKKLKSDGSFWKAGLKQGELPFVKQN